MRQFFNHLRFLTINEKGATLIELLVATVIFLAVLIPLSSIYLSGVNLYTKTANEANLQNELDFVTADIMKKIQGATYFDLIQTEETTADTQKVFQLLQEPKLGSLIPEGALEEDYKPILSTYTRQVQYDKANDRPTSTLTKTMYQFQPSVGPEDPTEPTIQTFSYNHKEYLIYGLFQLDPSYQKLNLYLLIAPYSSNPAPYQQSSFSSLDDLQQYILTHQGPYEFIRVVKTQLSVGHHQRE